jgi:mannose-6-phosphate isomerase-like protein (cupin superfamily)
VLKGRRRNEEILALDLVGNTAVPPWRIMVLVCCPCFSPKLACCPVSTVGQSALAAARNLPWKPGRSAEVFLDGELELRFTPSPTKGPQKPHQRDELYFVAAGTARYRDEKHVTPVGPGDLCFAAANTVHGFEDVSDDFAIWIVFYGPVREELPTLGQ